MRLSPHPALHEPIRQTSGVVCRCSWCWIPSTLASATSSVGDGASVFTGDLLAFQSTCCGFAALLRHVVGFPDLGLLRGLRPIPGSSVDDGPARHHPHWAAGRAIPRWFPRSPCTGRRGRCPALLRQPRHTYAAGLRCGLPTDIRNRLRSRPPTGGGRALLTGPHPPGWSRRADYGALPTGSNFVYTFPSRLPDPDRLAVPTRPGVVGAAPTLTCVPRLGLPPASNGLLRQANGGVLSPPPGTRRLVAHPNGSTESRRVVSRTPLRTRKEVSPRRGSLRNRVAGGVRSHGWWSSWRLCFPGHGRAVRFRRRGRRVGGRGGRRPALGGPDVPGRAARGGCPPAAARS